MIYCDEQKGWYHVCLWFVLNLHLQVASAKAFIILWHINMYECKDSFALLILCIEKDNFYIIYLSQTLLHSLERAAADIGLHVNAYKTEYMCFNQRGDLSILKDSSLKLVDKFTYLGSSVSSTETDINMRLAKAWTAIDRLSVIWKPDLTDKMKRSFFPSSSRVYTAVWMHYWTLPKRMEKKLDSNYTRMLRAILNKSRRQHLTKQQLYCHLPPIIKTVQVRRTSHAEHCRRSRDGLMSDILLWTPSQGRVKAGRPARIYMQQLFIQLCRYRMSPWRPTGSDER